MPIIAVFFGIVIRMRLIRHWAVLHRADLEANWANVKSGKPLDKIAPLE